MGATEALQRVQAALDALVCEPRDVDTTLLKTLEQATDLLCTQHRFDNGRAGKTLSFGVDALRAWNAAFERVGLQVPDPKAFCAAAVWDAFAMRLMDVLNMPLSSASQRLRALIDRVCAGLDRMEDAPPVLARHLLTHSRTDPECQASLVVHEVLLARYGVSIFSEPPVAYYERVLFGIQNAFGSISRRSHLAITFMRKTSVDVWLGSLARSLCTAEERGAEHLVAHVVQQWLDVAPETLAPLLAAMDIHGSMHAMMSVLHAGKVRDLCAVEEARDDQVRISLAMLEACFAATSARMRVAAFALCVDAKTPAIPLTDAEMHGILRFFETSLVLPSAVARKDTIAMFVKLLVRIRTSANKMKRERERVYAMRELLQKVFRRLAHAVHPGASYASTSLAMSLLFLLAEATAPQEDYVAEVQYCESALQDAIRARRKAQKTYPATSLMPFEAQVPLLHRLLYFATESTYSDIQSTVVQILLRRSTRGDSFWADTAFVWTHVVEPSLSRLTATKESDANAGVQLLKLYHQACFAYTHEHFLLRMGADANAYDDWTSALVNVHLARLERQLDDAQNSLAHASHRGLHGTLAALTYLVGASTSPLPYDRIRAIVRRVWELVSPVLCAAAPENADDQTELGYAPEQEEEEDSHVSPTSQRILSFSWRAMREAAALHEVCTLADESDKHVEEANELFLTWMLCIRHRGAFSTVYPRYQSMASAVCAKSPAPSSWLKATIDRVEQRATTLSTTRRSAGLGYAVLALLSAHKGKRLADLTTTAVTRLLYMAMDSEGVRTIHAMNILRVLVMDSTMASAMRSHLGEALACAVTSFQSPDWGVRNAAMMLFSAISTRYFGTSAFGRRVVSAPRGPNLEALWRESDALAHALTHTLNTCVREQDTDTNYSSALYAVLCLLSRSDVSMCTDQILEAVRVCTRNRHAAVRGRAAHCYAALVRPAQREEEGKRLLSEATTRDQNALSGALAVLQQWALPAYRDALAERIDLLEANPCPVTVAAFLELAEACSAVDVIQPWLCAWVQQGSSLQNDPLSVWLLPVVMRLALRHVKVPVSLLHVDGDARAAVLDVLHKEPDMLLRLDWDKAAMHEAFVHTLLDESAQLQVRVHAVRLADMLGMRLDVHAHALISLAVSTESVLLREALLPLLGRGVQADTLETCLWIWEMCAKDDAPPASRLGVVHALRHVQQPHVRKDLLVLRLLRDDDAHVRETACKLCDAPPAAHTFTSVSMLQRGPEACADSLWRKHVSNPIFQTYIWQLLVPKDGTCRHIHTDASTNDVSLFPVEAANQFYDPVTDVMRAFDTCMTSSVPAPPSLDTWAREAWEKLQKTTAADVLTPTAYLHALQRACLVRVACRAGLFGDDVKQQVQRQLQNELLVPTGSVESPTRAAPVSPLHLKDRLRIA